MSLLGVGGPPVNKFEQVSSTGNNMSESGGGAEFMSGVQGAREVSGLKGRGVP